MHICVNKFLQIPLWFFIWLNMFFDLHINKIKTRFETLPIDNGFK